MPLLPSMPNEEEKKIRRTYTQSKKKRTNGCARYTRNLFTINIVVIRDHEERRGEGVEEEEEERSDKVDERLVIIM